MDSEKKISPAVINRLPRYYRYLGDLLESDITRISSKELSAKMSVLVFFGNSKRHYKIRYENMHLYL